MHNASLLIHFDGINRVVRTLVTVVANCSGECVVHVRHTRAEQIAEVQERWRSKATLTQPLHDFEQIDFATDFARGAHDDMALLIDIEESLRPTAQVVEIRGIINRPRSLHRRPELRSTRSGASGRAI